MAEVIDVMEADRDTEPAVGTELPKVVRQAGHKTQETKQPTKKLDPAITVVERSQLTPLEKYLFVLSFNYMQEITKSVEDAGVKNAVEDAKGAAMSAVMAEKFKIKNLEEAREKNLKLSIKDDGMIELLKHRD